MASDIKLIHGDCMEFMAKIKDKAFDLAIVDPPYGIGDFVMKSGTNKVNKRNYKKGLEWNESGPTNQYFKELSRVSKNQIIWGANYYNCFTTGGALIWYKNIGHLCMSQCEIAACSFQKKVDYVRIPWASGFYRTLFGPTIHPCQKPVDLYAWCIKNYAKEGDKILDTHLGSGSIAIACYDMGFDLTGYEIDLEYFNAAVKRLETHKKQFTLFDEASNQPLHDKDDKEAVDSSNDSLF